MMMITDLRIDMTSLTYNNKPHTHNDCGITQNVLFPRTKKWSYLAVVVATVLSIDRKDYNGGLE